MNINSKGIHDCCGCTICATACTKGCITIYQDKEGYYCAHADDSVCTNCEKCLSVCNKFKKYETDATTLPLECYVGYNNNHQVRVASSSGGIASALAQTAIENGYCVVGATLDLGAKTVRHILIENYEDIELIRGSKYFPSYATDVARELKKSEKALIIATPCQIYAMKQLYTDKKDFIYVDFKCFGPSGYRLFHKYFDYLNTINQSGIKRINFRDKHISWKAWGPKIEFNDGTIYHKSNPFDPWALIFNHYHYLKDSCLSCDHYKSVTAADIRIEDAWHQMQQVSKDSWKNGLSLISVHTQKGKEFFAKTRSKLSIERATPAIWRPKKRTVSKKLRELMSNDALDICSVIKEYKKTLPLKRRVALTLEQLIIFNRALYLAIWKVFKFIKK